MRKPLALVGLVASLLASGEAGAAEARPTVVLVHGAFAGSESWQAVTERLHRDGYTVVAAANPLRGVASDAAAVAALVKAIPTEVVLVGHSYGGTVISAAASEASNVKSLVYVAGFAPAVGESTFELSSRYPGSTLGDTIAPVELADEQSDLYIRQDRFHAQFAADLPADVARLMAAAQRPLSAAAGQEAATKAAWTTIPSWWVYGSGDRNIPPQAMAFMAERAGSRRTVVVPGASHVVMISHPDVVAALIREAAQ